MSLIADFPLINTLPSEARVLITVGTEEYLCSLQQLSDQMGTAGGGGGGAESLKTVIASGLTAYAPPSFDWSDPYADFYVRLTSALTFTLPTVPIEQANSKGVIVVDSRQDATGGRNITFSNVSGWFNVNPFNTSNPTELQVNKAANSYSMFSFRVINGFWFANYGRVV